METENNKSKRPLIIIVSILISAAIILAIILPIVLNGGIGGSQTKTKLEHDADGWLTMDAMLEVFEVNVEIKYYNDYRVDDCELVTDTVFIHEFLSPNPSDMLYDFRYYKEITFTFKFDQRLKIEQFQYQEKGNVDKSYIRPSDSFSDEHIILNSVDCLIPFLTNNPFPFGEGTTPSSLNNYCGTIRKDFTNENWQINTGLKPPLYTNSLPTNQKKLTLIFDQENTSYNPSTGIGSNIFMNDSLDTECYRMANTCIYDFKLKIDTTIF